MRARSCFVFSVCDLDNVACETSSIVTFSGEAIQSAIRTVTLLDLWPCVGDQFYMMLAEDALMVGLRRYLTARSTCRPFFPNEQFFQLPDPHLLETKLCVLRRQGSLPPPPPRIFLPDDDHFANLSAAPPE